MKRKMLICLITASLLTTHTLAMAIETDEPPAREIVIEAKNNIYVPDSPIVKEEKAFAFDWNNYKTILPNLDKMLAIEGDILRTIREGQLRSEDKQAIGKLYYKVGTYYLHVERDPDEAIKRMEIARRYLKNKVDIAWNYDQLAYAYEQKFAISGDTKDKDMALRYINLAAKVIPKSVREPNVAFSHYVQGQINMDMGAYKIAESHYQQALALYKKNIYRGTQQDQYLKLKNKLGAAIFNQPGRQNEGLALLEEVEESWDNLGGMDENPYAARNLVYLGNAYLAAGKAQAAQNELDEAVNIYQHVLGKRCHNLLVEPYEQLADTCKILGNLNEMDEYLQKADQLETKELPKAYTHLAAAE